MNQMTAETVLYRTYAPPSSCGGAVIQKLFCARSRAAGPALQGKHYQRKHGPHAYYGQP